MLLLRVEKPPVATMEKAWFSASKASILQQNNKRNVIAVLKIYKSHKLRALSAIFGCNLSFTGPAVSARTICIAPAPRLDSKATNKTIIPMPPSQWVTLRHIKMARGCPSISSSTEAPTVANPDIASKNASATVSNVPASR